jgi:rare lipoprotein A
MVAAPILYAPVPVYADGRALIGTASWYGSFHHGRRMANGRRFDMWGSSVAHRTLPFGTRILVTNLNNERTVLATVEDRGPFIAGRILDVSRGLARRLDFERHGHTLVRIDIVN